jgi:predicted Zn-dependent protease
MSATRRPTRIAWGLLVVLLYAAVPATAKKTDISGNKMDNVYDIGNRRVAHHSFISLDKEISIGKHYAAQINRSSKILKDPVITEYVNRVEQNIAENSDAKEPISVQVIESPEINAFTLPGGFIYVDTGLLRAVRSEAELAAVLSHETGHVAARHWAAEQTRQTLLQYAMIPLIFTPMSYPVYLGLSQGLNVAIPISFLKFSREDEQQADFLGLQYMWKAGYDPNAFLSMFAKIMRQERSDPGSVPSIFLDHPPTEARILRAAEEIKNILPPRQQYLVSTSEFQHVQERLNSILGRMNRNKSDENKPTLLRRQPKTEQPAGGQQGTDDDKPPVLRRRN